MKVALSIIAMFSILATAASAQAIMLSSEEVLFCEHPWGYEFTLQRHTNCIGDESFSANLIHLFNPVDVDLTCIPENNLSEEQGQVFSYNCTDSSGQWNVFVASPGRAWLNFKADSNAKLRPLEPMQPDYSMNCTELPSN